MHRENGHIVLSHEELAEIKKEAQDEGVFRERVLTHIKTHSGLPELVAVIDQKTNTNWRLIVVFFIALVGLACTVIGK